MRTVIAAVLIVAGGVATLAWATDGFHAFTLETARRLEIAAQPRPVPPVILQDQQDRTFTLEDFQGKHVIATFIYTRCRTVCPVEGAWLAWLQRAMDQEPGSSALLLSVSFDPLDAREDLARYADHYGATVPRWRVARFTDPAAREELLRSLGVVVIPDRAGGFVHNAAFYLIDPQGRVVAVFDLESAPEILAALRERS